MEDTIVKTAMIGACGHVFAAAYKAAIENPSNSTTDAGRIARVITENFMSQMETQIIENPKYTRS
jgi:hypothetical protein